MTPTDAMLLAALSRTFLSWRRHVQRKLAPAGCSIQQYHVLRQLARRGSLAPSAIAKMLHADRPTASLVIANLAQAGWVELSRDPADGRRRIVAATAQGLAVLANARALLAADAAAFQPLAGLDDSERAQLLDLLTRVERGIADVESMAVTVEEADEGE